MIEVAKMRVVIAICTLFLVLNTSYASNCQGSSVWSWQCQNDRCVKVLASSKATSIELDTCKLTCGSHSMLFPKPSGTISFGKTTVPFLPTRMRLNKVTCNKVQCLAAVRWLLDNAFNFMVNDLHKVYQLHSSSVSTANLTPKCAQEASQREVQVNVNLKAQDRQLTLTTDESYSLSVSTTATVITVDILAENFFGARHGFESLSQLTAYKYAHNSMQMVSPVNIQDDKPAYPYRGILLDTSRNYFSADSIMRLITAMGYNKMNTLHWHITDTHSFPIEIKSQPELQSYGAYSPRHTYSHADVAKIVTHGKIHGVRVLPEFDEPAHCGEGWQFGPKLGLGNLAVCVNKEPWQKYCVEPPCGQLNPTNDNVYDVLGKIYKEYVDLFQPDIFHAGGDEVNINCWNTTNEITSWLKKNYGGVSEQNFMDMWGYFLKKSTKKLQEATNGKELPMILWTSKMTTPKYLTKYLNKDKHIIQIWTGSKDNHLANVVKQGFKTIFSTYDTLYLDCGYGNWLVEGNNWCSPYKDWKLLYDNDPVKILQSFNVKVTPAVRKTILGQESAMWSEQVDEASSEGKIWPRSAALAERLWSNPSHNWRNAEYRFIYHRERMVERGIKADAIQPLWCEQNAGHCYYDPNIKGEH